MPGAAAPATSRANVSEAHERSHHRFRRINRHSPRNGFTAYSVLSPASEFLLSPSLADLGSSNPVELDFASASLAPATGVRTTGLPRPLKRRSSRTLADRSRGSSRPAIAMARLTLSRPPHPAPRS